MVLLVFLKCVMLQSEQRGERGNHVNHKERKKAWEEVGTEE